MRDLTDRLRACHIAALDGSSIYAEAADRIVALEAARDDLRLELRSLVTTICDPDSTSDDRRCAIINARCSLERNEEAADAE